MHELGLIRDLLRKIGEIASEHGGGRVEQATVRLGALAHISADHLREHFERGTEGTLAEGARLVVEVADDPDDPRAQEIVLVSVDLVPGEDGG